MQGVNRIEGVERFYVYVNDESSFQLVPESEPSYVIKSTLRMERI
jgi:hypothetical protein